MHVPPFPSSAVPSPSVLKMQRDVRGTAVGAGVGADVGAAVGDAVGVAVGDAVGAAVGDAVGGGV